MAGLARIMRIEMHARYLKGLLGRRSPLRAYDISGVPDDAEIAGFALDPARPSVLTIYVQSDTFPLLDDGEIIPVLTLTEHSIDWPEAIVDQMETWLKEQDIPYRSLPDVRR